MNKHLPRFGFTIVELLVVIVILSTFAVLGSFGYNKLKDRQINEKARTNAEGIASALDEIYMAGQTIDGATDNKGNYPSLQDACIKDGAAMEQIVQKQKNIDKDFKVTFLSATSPERFSQNLSGCEVLSNGEISLSCIGELSESAQLLTCNSEKEIVDAGQIENIGTIIYQPIINTKAVPEHVDTSNSTWQCLGKGFTAGMPGDPVVADSAGCRGFYIYYLEKSGDKIKLSEAIIGKY